jgi:hypothetical protein
MTPEEIKERKTVSLLLGTVKLHSENYMPSADGMNLHIDFVWSLEELQAFIYTGKRHEFFDYCINRVINVIERKLKDYDGYDLKDSPFYKDGIAPYRKPQN